MSLPLEGSWSTASRLDEGQVRPPDLVGTPAAVDELTTRGPLRGRLRPAAAHVVTGAPPSRQRRRGPGRPRSVPIPRPDQGPERSLAERSLALRRLVLEVAHQARVGHIASCLSIADILTAAFAVMDPDHDTFVLSKGHAALALYACLHQRNLISRADLFSYCSDNSLFSVHPDHHIPGVRFTTGSLGYGLAYAVGVSLAQRIGAKPGRAIAVLSDAEVNEGSVWESIMFAGHHRLPVTAIVDVNGQQALGRTREVLDLAPLAPKLAAFGWSVRDVDGHDPGLILAALRPDAVPGPVAVLARTVAGRGVTFMEGRVEWHYWPLNDTQLAQALADLDRPAR